MVYERTLYVYEKACVTISIINIHNQGYKRGGGREHGTDGAEFTPSCICKEKCKTKRCVCIKSGIKCHKSRCKCKPGSCVNQMEEVSTHTDMHIVITTYCMRIYIVYTYFIQASVNIEELGGGRHSADEDEVVP